MDEITSSKKEKRAIAAALKAEEEAIVEPKKRKRDLDAGTADGKEAPTPSTDGAPKMKASEARRLKKAQKKAALADGSCYKEIDGVKYDKGLLEKSDSLTTGRGDGRISKEDAEKLLEDTQDGKGVTEGERKTLQYILDNYNCTDAGKEVLVAKLGDDAAGEAKSAGKAGTVFVSFVGGMPPSFDIEVFRNEFGKCGKIVDLKVPMQAARKGRDAVPRGFMFVTFATSKGVKRAVSKNLSMFGDRKLVVKVSDGKSDSEKNAKRVKKGDEKQDTTVIVKNLPHKADESEVRAYFQGCGNFAGCRFIASKGVAFVRFIRPEGFQKALELNEKEFQGRTLYVSKAKDYSEKA